MIDSQLVPLSLSVRRVANLDGWGSFPFLSFNHALRNLTMWKAGDLGHVLVTTYLSL